MSLNYRDPTTGNLTRLDGVTMDSSPTSGSNNAVSSGGVYTALENKSNLSNITTVEATTTASKSYAVDDLLIYDGQLYKVTTAIASGGTITTSGANANVSATTISANLGGDTSTFMVKGVDFVTAGKLTNTTLGANATAEGFNNTASGAVSHAEGSAVEALAYASHAEGYFSKSHAEAAHAEGYFTKASGNYSHSGGYATIAQRVSQTVIGEYNVADTTGSDGTAKGSYVFIIGNGTGSNARANAFTVDWNGNVIASGTLKGSGGVILPINPSSTPTENGAMWITT